MIRPENIPAELKQSRRWVLWALCDVNDKGKVRKNCKVPFTVQGSPADHSAPATWNTFDEILAAHARDQVLTPPANSVFSAEPKRGIGMVLGPPFIGCDLDKCRVDGVISEEAQRWIAELNSYTEISQSGTGVHIILHGEPPYKEGHRKDDREVYSSNRYFCFTGDVLEGHEEIRRFTPAEVKALYERVKAGRSANKSSTHVMDSKTSGTYTAAKIADLMERTDGDHSQMVMSLLTLLAIEHVNNRDKIESEFKKSKLYLETGWSGVGGKWDRLRVAELDKACKNAAENIAKRLANGKAESVRELDEVSGDEVERDLLQYAWDPPLPLGKLTHFNGPQGGSKSPVVVDLLARITRGGDFPNGAKNGFGESRHVLLCNIEDDPGDTTMPRFDLAGGIPFLMHIVKGVRISKNDSFSKGLMTLDRDIELIAKRAREIEGLGAIVFDPITNYLGKVKMNQDEEVRTVLTPLAQLAEELNIVVLTVGHNNRRTDSSDPLTRIMGSAAFSGVARSVWSFANDDDVDSPYAHVMSPTRGKVGADSIKFHTEEVSAWIGPQQQETKVIRVVWDGTSKQTSEEGFTPTSRKDKSKTKQAGKALRDFLKAGKRSATSCISFLETGGFDMKKLDHGRVRRVAGADSVQADRQWWWFLPEAANMFEKPQGREDSGVPGF